MTDEAVDELRAIRVLLRELLAELRTVQAPKTRRCHLKKGKLAEDVPELTTRVDAALRRAGHWPT